MGNYKICAKPNSFIYNIDCSHKSGDNTGHFLSGITDLNGVHSFFTDLSWDLRHDFIDDFLNGKVFFQRRRRLKGIRCGQGAGEDRGRHNGLATILNKSSSVHLDKVGNNKGSLKPAKESFE